MIPGMKYAGPNNPLEQQIKTERLKFNQSTGEVNGSTIFINPGNEPVSALDAIALRHDCEYLNASTKGSNELRYKHLADARMIEAIKNMAPIDKITPWNVYQKVVSGIAKGLITAKYKLGLGIGFRTIVNFLQENPKKETLMKKALTTFAKADYVRTLIKNNIIYRL